MMKEFVVRDISWSDLLPTGSVLAVGLRPQRLAAVESYCLRCGQQAWPVRTRGRWDEERGATALPYDPVSVEMSCGCKFGDESLANPGESPT